MHQGSSATRVLAEAFAADVGALIDVLMALHQAAPVEWDDDETASGVCVSPCFVCFVFTSV